MSAVREGKDPHTCFIHGFATQDSNAWDQHCTETPHFDIGHSPCVMCKQKVEFTEDHKIPFTPLAELKKSNGLRPKVLCNDCKAKVKSQ